MGAVAECFDFIALGMVGCMACIVLLLLSSLPSLLVNVNNSL